jgi:hypothetical protein
LSSLCWTWGEEFKILPEDLKKKEHMGYLLDAITANMWTVIRKWFAKSGTPLAAFVSFHLYFKYAKLSLFFTKTRTLNTLKFKEFWCWRTHLLLKKPESTQLESLEF